MDSINKTERPQAIFFDWDGTLVDTLPWLLSVHNHVRSCLGYEEWSVAEFKKIIRYSSRELYGRLYGAREPEAQKILHEYMEANHLENLEVLPDALELLKYLHDNAIPSGIISNKRHPFLIKEVKYLGWENLVRIVIGAGYAQKDKPAADPLLSALKHCELNPDKTIWYVGDSVTDILTAQAAGCTPVLVRHNHDNEHLVEEYALEHVFDDCQKLKKILQQFALAA